MDTRQIPNPQSHNGNTSVGVRSPHYEATGFGSDAATSEIYTLSFGFMDLGPKTQTTEARSPVPYTHRGIGGGPPTGHISLPLSFSYLFLLKAFERCFGMVIIK